MCMILSSLKGHSEKLGELFLSRNPYLEMGDYETLLYGGDKRAIGNLVENIGTPAHVLEPWWKILC